MIRFPPVHLADGHGLLCVSDTIDAALVWAAYRQGAFPWTDDPVGWFAPAMRGLLWPASAHFPRNLGRYWRAAGFRITLDQAFAAVIDGCRAAHRGEGEWITANFVRAYTDLARLGRAHSVEVWQGNELVGGTYGVAVGNVFSAESMFGTVDHASRAALFALTQAAGALGIAVIDVQVLSPASEAMGARAVPRSDFMQLLQAALRSGPGEPCRWPAHLLAALTDGRPIRLPAAGAAAPAPLPPGSLPPIR